MQRRSFLKLIGIGATVPVVAKAATPKIEEIVPEEPDVVEESTEDYEECEGVCDWSV